MKDLIKFYQVIYSCSYNRNTNDWECRKGLYENSKQIECPSYLPHFLEKPYLEKELGYSDVKILDQKLCPIRSCVGLN